VKHNGEPHFVIYMRTHNIVNMWWNNIIGSWTYYSLSEHGRKPNSNHKSYKKAQTSRVCYVDVGLFSTRNWLHPIYQLKGSSWILPKWRGLWIFHRPQIVEFTMFQWGYFPSMRQWFHTPNCWFEVAEC
jgi:hypothetical protein